MKVFIDADGCPVVNITVAICRANDIDVTLVCDTSHYFASDYAKVVTVDKGADSADMALGIRRRHRHHSGLRSRSNVSC